MSQFSQIVVLIKRFGRRAAKQKTNRILGLCIMVCSFVAASLGFFSNSVQMALDNDIANYLGAPLVVRSDQQLPRAVFDIDGLEAIVNTVSFTTGALNDKSYQSVSLKGVSDSYPLQGELLIRTASGTESRSGASLSTGSVWLDPHVINELELKLGDLIQIGSTSLKFDGELVHEPDRLTQLSHALPSAMVNLDTLTLTGVSVDNERGKYRVLIDGDEQALSQLESKLQSSISLSYEVLKPGKGRHPFSRISLRAERLTSVVLVLILLMCGGAAAILADHSVRSYAMPASVLRCMGVKRRAVAWALCTQLILLALVMSVVGCVLAWIIQPMLLSVMEPHMTLEVVAFKVDDLLAPIGVGMVTVIGFVVPKMQQLGSIPVNSVLRGVLEQSKPSYLTIFFASVAGFIMLWVSSDNLELTKMLVIAVVSLIVLSLSFGWGLSKLSAQTHHLLKGPSKVAVRSIGRSPRRYITSLVSVSIVMMALLMTVTLRGNFLDVLKLQTLETDGNYIYTGLPADKADNFRHTIKSNKAELKGMYPTVSAKLVSINGVTLDSALNKESDTREETRSKVRLSWAENLPDNNRLRKGNWPAKGSNGVSVEYEVMSDLGLQIGDELGFQIGNSRLTSTIVSEREYQGGGSRMMFWFMFAPDALAPFEQQYMGGILLGDSSSSVLSKISHHFPQLKVTDLERQISGIRDIMIVLTRLMNTTLFLLLLGALMIVIASSYVSVKNRQVQSGLMRVIGLRRSQRHLMSVTEQLIVTLVACAVGIIGVQLVAGLLFHNLFNLSYELEWGRALILTATISLVFTSFAWMFSYRQSQQAIALS